MPYDLPRIPLPTDASSADLARLPAAIRRQALFSARLNRVEPLVEIGSSIKGILDGGKSMSEARRDIRKSLDAAGYRPPEGAEGGLLDHTSRRRLDLILEQNVRASRGFGKWAADMDPDVLDLWPAQELIRVMARLNPRGDWKERWQAAGGKLYGGRMIALKTSPVWVNLSRFGEPYPPYDYGSGMGVMDVDRDEAVRLGLLTETEELTPEPVAFPEMTEARLPDLEAMPDLRDAVLKVMGDGASFQDGVLSMPTPAVEVAGATGSARSLDLAGLSDHTVTPAPATVPEEEAVALIRSETAVARAPDGYQARFTPSAYEHWRDRPAERTRRMQRIRQAFAAVQEPQEIWERGGRRFYLKTFEDRGKTQRMMVIVGQDGEVESWIPSVRKRTGALLYKEGAR